MTRDGSTGIYKPSVPMTWGTDGRTAYACAWTLPVDADDEGYAMSGMAQTVSVAADQTTADAIRRSDFLCASTELGDEDSRSVTVNGDALDITFLHVFCKIDIRCHLSAEMKMLYPDARVSKVEIGGVYRGAPFNFDYCSPVFAGNEYVTDQGTVTAYLNEPEAGTGDVIAEAIMVPQYFIYDLQLPTLPDERATLTVTLTNGGVEKAMPPVRITTGSFLAGTRYTMTVSIGRDDVFCIGDITVQPWTETEGETYIKAE